MSTRIELVHINRTPEDPSDAYVLQESVPSADDPAAARLDDQVPPPDDDNDHSFRSIQGIVNTPPTISPVTALEIPPTSGVAKGEDSQLQPMSREALGATAAATVTKHVVEQPTHSAVEEIAATGDKPWSERAGEAAKPARTSEQSPEPTEGCEDTPSAEFTDGDSGQPPEEPPRPPEPPDGNDSEPEEWDDAERRRLAKEMEEFSRLIKPLMGIAENIQWLHTASRADMKLYAEVDKTAESLGQKLKASDYEALKSYANRAASKLLQEGECSVGKSMAIHVIMSERVSTIYADAKLQSYPKLDKMSNSGSYFLTQFANALAWRMPAKAAEEGPNPFNLNHEARQHNERLASGMGETTSWMDAKLQMFNTALIFRRKAELEVNKEVTLETASPDELRRYNNRLVGQVEAKRHFAVKPIVHKGENTAWSLHDFADVRERHAAMATAEGSEIRPQDWSPNMRLIAMEHDPDDAEAARHILTPGIASAGKEELRTSGMGIGVARVCFMDKKGELYADWTGNMPLRELYERHGKSVNYEALRQYLVGAYFKFSVPIAVEREAQVAAEATLGSEADQLPQGRDPQNREVIHDAHLPRLSVLGRYPKKELALKNQAELREGAVLDDNGHIVGYTRKIGSEYSASQAAREEAARYGVELPDKALTFEKVLRHSQ